jgi:hypothetical protein
MRMYLLTYGSARARDDPRQSYKTFDNVNYF